MKSEVFLIGRIFVNNISALRGCFQTFLGMLTFLLLRRDCWKLFHMLGLHILFFFFIAYVCFSCSVGDFALQGDSGLCLLKLLWKGKRSVCQLLLIKGQFGLTASISHYFWSIFCFLLVLSTTSYTRQV